MNRFAIRAIGNFSKTIGNVRNFSRLGSSFSYQALKPKPWPMASCQAPRYSTSAKPDPFRVNVNITSDYVELDWDGKGALQYPILWLRDNCRCPKCYNPSSMSRKLLMRNLDINTYPAEVKVNEGTENIHIKWSDGHESSFNFDWLKSRSFTRQVRKSRKEWMKNTKNKLWNNADMQDKIPTVPFDKLLSDDRALYDWITTLEETGIIRIVETPTRNGELLKLADRVAFLRKTNYGEMFQVKAKLDPSNQGYTPDALDLHTDLAYYWNPPFVACHHCISQAPSLGGLSEVADGFYVAELMRNNYPEHFKTLTTVPVDFYDEGTDFYQFYNLTKHYIIGLDSAGEVKRIVYNNPVRDTFLTVPVEQVQPLYRALKLYDDLMHDPANLITFKLVPGDIICYQNIRILHGRTAYEVLEKGERELEGGNLDWDELFSRRRVIASQLGITNETVRP